jgi:ribonuclease BN (tRNA processing enzyme)
MLDITFYGVRGSTPCSGPAVARYGGNTSCVVVEIPGEDPIVCDLGTGVRSYGLAVPPDRPFRATALVTHLHWDHIQGLPFFGPVLRPGSELDIIGPVQRDQTLEEAIASAVAPPMFPIALAELPGEVRIRELDSACLRIGSATVTVFPVPHVGPTNGYRIDAGGVSMAYISDCQQPLDGSLAVPSEVVERCRGVDVVIHDAQYDGEEFAQKPTWGHCTAAYAVEVARAMEASTLVLYHHDPVHDDAWIDRSVEQARDAAAGAFEVVAAEEGMVVRIGERGPGRS